MGNDLVRFLDLVIGRPAIVSGLSSGGVLAAWLSAYAKPGQVLGALYEDPPLFASEVRPAVGPGIRQCIGPLFDLWSTFLGDQWSIGAWDAMREGSAARLPEHMPKTPTPLNRLFARESQKLRCKNTALMVVGVLRGSTSRVASLFLLGDSVRM